MDVLGNIWPYLGAVLSLGLSLAASVHVVLTKRDVRAAIGWVGLAWLVPLAGPLLYAGFGINRISRRGAQIGEEMHRLAPGRGVLIPKDFERLPAATIGERMRSLARAIDRVTHLAPAPGNAVAPLGDGDAAYRAMLAAIDEARASVGLSTYIFDNDAAGTLFVDALSRAAARGVDVRVLVDAVGARYSTPRTTAVLRGRGVPVAEFMSSFALWRMPYFNLRNHRKILVVDGQVGFAGGMNIRDDYLPSAPARSRVQDLHFRIEGPVVRHLAEVFAKDWAFTTGERLEGESWFPVPVVAGSTVARGVPDGPDDDFERLHWTLLAALAHAQTEVRVVTPYFLPGQALINALNVTTMRGVRVDIVLPEASNLRIVGWAMRARLSQVMQFGCRVWLSARPFDHTKLMLVDGEWCLFGSGNWDPRSLRLNFEFNVECYDRELVSKMDVLIQDRINRSRPIGRQELDERPLPARLRDGAAWLLSPYL